MSRCSKGDRVGAVSHTEGKRLFLYGYGTYLGRVKPSECEEKPIGVIGEMLVEADSENALIQLDDGSHVWGCECWWGSEELVQKQCERFEVETVSIRDKRAACAS